MGQESKAALGTPIHVVGLLPIMVTWKSCNGSEVKAALGTVIHVQGPLGSPACNGLEIRAALGTAAHVQAASVKSQIL